MFRRPWTLLAAAALLASCADGTTLREPDTANVGDQSIVIPSEPQAQFGSGTEFELSSFAFEHEGTIPAVYSRRDGDDVSPPMAWQHPPEGTVELALVITDPNAQGFVHWVIWGLDPASTGIDTGQVPPGAQQATNDFGEVGYGGPAPPDGETHAYVFQLFALGRTAFDVADATMGRDVITALEERAIGVTELFAFYG